MKYLIIFILVLFYSCSQSDMETGGVHTKIYWHKSADQLRGPVAEVKQNDFTVSGNIASYEVHDMDSVNEFKPFKTLRYNEVGFIVYKEELYEFWSVNKIRDHVKFEFFYNASHIAREKSSFRREEYSRGTLERSHEKQFESFFKFKRGVVEKSSHSDGDTLYHKTKIDYSDSVIVYTPVGKVKESTGYSLGDDDIYRMTFFKDSSLQQEYTYTFIDGKLAQQTETSVNLAGTKKDPLVMDSDTQVVYIEYNEQGDPVITRTTGKSPAPVREFRYLYDEQGNWIEKVFFLDGRAVNAKRREITYW